MRHYVIDTGFKWSWPFFFRFRLGAYGYNWRAAWVAGLGPFRLWRMERI